jgi:hypothetical protein
MLAACSATEPVKLEPIPVPPPILVEVPSYIPLPPDATTACEIPRARPVKTDVDLLNVAMAWKVTALCNAGKLGAIGEKQP